METLLYITLFAPLVGSIFAGALGGYKKNILDRKSVV